MIGQPAIDSGRLCAPFDFEVATGHGYFLRWQAPHAERAEISHLAELFGDALSAQQDGAAPRALLLRKD